MPSAHVSSTCCFLARPARRFESLEIPALCLALLSLGGCGAGSPSSELPEVRVHSTDHQNHEVVLRIENSAGVVYEGIVEIEPDETALALYITPGSYDVWARAGNLESNVTVLVRPGHDLHVRIDAYPEARLQIYEKEHEDH
jgi:hypothetical protein